MEDKKRSKRKKDLKKHGWEKGGGIRKRSHLVELSAEGRVSFFFWSSSVCRHKHVLGLHWLVELSGMGLLYFLTETEGDEKEHWVKSLL
jgi:hypothetical protein